MIQLIRIDDRLLHGQVAYSWKAGLRYQAIIISDDDVANDDLRKKILKMASPSDVRVAIKNIDESIRMINNPKLKDVKIFVIVANPKSAYRLYEEINEKPDLNIGGMMKKSNSRKFSSAVYVDDEDYLYIEKIKDLGVNIDVRQTPTETSKDIASLVKKFKGESI